MHTNLSRPHVALDELIRAGLTEPDRERAKIYLCLTEAPAFPGDLAEPLGLAHQCLQEHLDALTAVGLIEPHGRNGETWYRVPAAAGPLDARLLTDRIHASAHWAPTATPRERRS